MLDSVAVFQARLRIFQIPEASIQLMMSKEVDTLAKLAFASGSTPGQDESSFIEMLVKNLEILGIGAISSGQLSGWRRAWFEAHTIMVSDMRARVERTDDSAPRRIPVPERAAKLAAQKRRLTGVSITGPLLPSYALLDFVVTMREEETLKYVDPSKCTSREDELVGVKREQFIKPNAAGVLVVKEGEDSAHTDMTTEHRVRQALQRRSLALDQAELLPYRDSEDYHDFLYSLVAMLAPPKFHPIDLVQILNADRAIWQRMTEHTASGISMRPDGTYPIKDAMVLARAHPMVACLLQPLPRGGKGNSIPREGPYSNKQAKMGGNQKGSKGTKGSKEGKGSGQKGSKNPKGRGKSSGKPDRMPWALIGQKSRTADGNKLCFDYNLPSGCSKEVTAGKCSSGTHACCGCLSTAHGYQTCSV